MNDKRTLKNWQLAFLYFLTYLFIIFLLGVLYTVIVANISNSFDFGTPIIVGWIFWGVSILIIPAGIILSSMLIKKKFLIKNVNLVVLYATLMNFVFELLFVVRDFLVTEIHGMPLMRNHPVSIANKALDVIVFYYLSKLFLNKNQIFSKSYKYLKNKYL